MQVYTKSALQNAYTVGASELAKKIAEEAYEHAKWCPDDFKYSKRIFIHRMLAEVILKNLQTVFPGCSVTMDYKPDGNDQGMVDYTINWS